MFTKFYSHILESVVYLQLISGSFLQVCISGASMKPIILEEDFDHVTLMSYKQMDQNNNQNILTEKK